MIADHTLTDANVVELKGLIGFYTQGSKNENPHFDVPSSTSSEHLANMLPHLDFIQDLGIPVLDAIALRVEVEMLVCAILSTEDLTECRTERDHEQRQFEAVMQWAKGCSGDYNFAFVFRSPAG